MPVEPQMLRTASLFEGRTVTLHVLAGGHGGVVDGNAGHASSGVRSGARPDTTTCTTT